MMTQFLYGCICTFPLSITVHHFMHPYLKIYSQIQMESTDLFGKKNILRNSFNHGDDLKEAQKNIIKLTRGGEHVILLNGCFVHTYCVCACLYAYLLSFPTYSSFLYLFLFHTVWICVRVSHCIHFSYSTPIHLCCFVRSGLPHLTGPLVCPPSWLCFVTCESQGHQRLYGLASAVQEW